MIHTLVRAWAFDDNGVSVLVQENARWVSERKTKNLKNIGANIEKTLSQKNLWIFSKNDKFGARKTRWKRNTQQEENVATK